MASAMRSATIRLPVPLKWPGLVVKMLPVLSRKIADRSRVSMPLAGPIWDMSPPKVTKPTRAIADYGVCFRSIAVTAPTYAARC